MMNDNAIIEALNDEIAELQHQLQAAKCDTRTEVILLQLADYIQKAWTPHYIYCSDPECVALRADSDSYDNARYFYLLKLTNWLRHPSTAHKFTETLTKKDN